MRLRLSRRSLVVPFSAWSIPTLSALVDPSTASGRHYQIENASSEDGWVGGWRGDAGAFRFQPPLVEPCMRFSRTRLTVALHRRCSTGARQARLGLGAATIPC